MAHSDITLQFIVKSCICPKTIQDSCTFYWTRNYYILYYILACTSKEQKKSLSVSISGIMNELCKSERVKVLKNLFINGHALYDRMNYTNLQIDTKKNNYHIAYCPALVC